jgi:putative addiction module component (TIGR02574 family)
MAPLLKEIERQARALSAEERAQLAETLLDTLREPPLVEIDAAWDREIEQRVSAYDRGELQTHSAEDVFAEAAVCSSRAHRISRRSDSLPRD